MLVFANFSDLWKKKSAEDILYNAVGSATTSVPVKASSLFFSAHSYTPKASKAILLKHHIDGVLTLQFTGAVEKVINSGETTYTTTETIVQGNRTMESTSSHTSPGISATNRGEYFAATLVGVNNNKLVWHATGYTGGLEAQYADMFSSCANKIIRQLIDDGVLLKSK